MYASRRNSRPRTFPHISTSRRCPVAESVGLTVWDAGATDIATGEVTPLKHELRDDAVKLGASVSKAFFARAERTEVFDGLRDDLIVQVEMYAS